MTVRKDTSSELSRPVAVDRLGADGVTLEIVADRAERAALAERLGLPAIAALAASLTVRPEAGGIYHVTGRLTARLTQDCVVTLEPFETELAEEVDERFIDARGARPQGAGEVVLSDEEDGEPVTDGVIDLGELTAQALSLALDPYPRSPGAALPDSVAGRAEEGPAGSPFNALAGLLEGRRKRR